MVIALSDDMVAINIFQATSDREEESTQFYKIKYRQDFSEKEFDLVVGVRYCPPSTYRVQKLLIKSKVLQKFPCLIKELTGQRWVAVPAGEEAREIPDINHLWELPGIYIATCKQKSGSYPLAKQLENIKDREILVFYTLKEWWKKNKHLGFSQALKEYKFYLANYYDKIKELKNSGKKIDVRVGFVDKMKKIIAENNLPESNPSSWHQVIHKMEKPVGVLYEEFPPFGPVGVIDDVFSAFITFHSYDIKTGNLTYISVLIENNENVINQFLIWNTGINDLLDDMDFIKDTLKKYGVTKRQYDYHLIPMLEID